MRTVTSSNGVEIHYKDWGQGRPVVFSHGWPLSADAWDNQLVLVAEAGYRAIAHDRRGHGRSAQTWDGHDMDRYSDDLAAVIDALNLEDITLVGHSTGGGEVTRYLTRHGMRHVRSAVLLGAVTPLLLKSEANPSGVPMEVFDEIRAGVRVDRSQFYIDLSESFYGANRHGATVSEGLRRQFWRLGMQVGLKAALDCVKAFSETDFTADLGRIHIPVLVAHGDDDQVVPVDATARRTAELLTNSRLVVYAGAPHGLCGEFEQQFNADLLAFLKE